MRGIPKFYPERSRLAFKKYFSKGGYGQFTFIEPCWLEKYAGYAWQSDTTSYLKRLFLSFHIPVEVLVVVDYTGNLPSILGEFPNSADCRGTLKSSQNQMKSSNPKNRT